MQGEAKRVALCARLTCLFLFVCESRGCVFDFACLAPASTYKLVSVSYCRIVKERIETWYKGRGEGVGHVDSDETA